MKTDAVSKTTKQSKLLKSKKLRNILICSAPLLSFIFIQPEWLARLLAVTGCFTAFNILLFIYSLNPKTIFLIPRLARKGTEWDKRNIPRIIRVVVTLFACFMVWFVDKPTISDCIGVARNGRSYLLEIDGQVHANDLIFGAFFLIQNLSVTKSSELGGYSFTAVFQPRIAHVGKAYHFLVAPKSTLVLDWTNN
jgi:hypothetical protein